MNSVSLTMRRALNARESAEVALVLITIEHPDLDEPMRVSSDPTVRLSDEPYTLGTISRGETYFFAPMSILLPDDVQERAPTAQIQIENVSRSLVQLVRSTASFPSVTFEVVLASSPDLVEIRYPKFQLKTVTYNSTVMTLSLQINSLIDEPYPAGSFSPSYFPGLF